MNYFFIFLFIFFLFQINQIYFIKDIVTNKAELKLIRYLFAVTRNILVAGLLQHAITKQGAITD